MRHMVVVVAKRVISCDHTVEKQGTRNQQTDTADDYDQHEQPCACPKDAHAHDRRTNSSIAEVSRQFSTYFFCYTSNIAACSLPVLRVLLLRICFRVFELRLYLRIVVSLSKEHT